MSEFMGKNGFIWFVGVVEDRADPKNLGRLRVRCLGYHTEDLEQDALGITREALEYKDSSRLGRR